MTKKCKILKSGLKQCMYRCVNKQKIKTINRKIGFVVCKCWPNDKDNLCHWRLYGNNMAVDKAGFQRKKYSLIHDGCNPLRFFSIVCVIRQRSSIFLVPFPKNKINPKNHNGSCLS